MYHIKYIISENKLLVFKEKEIIFATTCAFPEDEWFDFSFGKIKYSLQILNVDMNLWAGMWNVSKVGEDTREDNMVKSDFEVIN